MMRLRSPIVVGPSMRTCGPTMVPAPMVTCGPMIAYGPTTTSCARAASLLTTAVSAIAEFISSFRPIYEHAEQLRLGHDDPGYFRDAAHLHGAGAAVKHFAFEDELVSRDDRPAKAGLVDSAEEKKLLRALFVAHLAQAEECRALGHGLHDQDARHHRRAGKVSLEKLLVRGHVLQTGDLLAILGDLEDPVDQQHRIAMRQVFHDLDDGHRHLRSFASSIRSI